MECVIHKQVVNIFLSKYPNKIKLFFFYLFNLIKIINILLKKY